MIKERRMDCMELRRLTVCCANCEAELTIDVEQEGQARALASRDPQREPLTCSVCGKDFDPAVDDAIRAFRVWRVRASEAGIVFKIPE